MMLHDSLPLIDAGRLIIGAFHRGGDVVITDRDRLVLGGNPCARLAVLVVPAQASLAAKEIRQIGA